MTSHQKHSRGFSLLELLLVFLIVALVTLLGIEHFQTFRKNEDLLILRKNAEILLSWASNYYDRYDTEPNPDFEHKSRQDLISDRIWQVGKLLPTRLVTSTLNDTNYNVSFVSVNGASCLNCFNIEAKIALNFVTDAATMEWYKNKLGAYDYTVQGNGFTLIWRQLPGHNMPSSETNLWVLKSTLDQFKQYAPKTQ